MNLVSIIVIGYNVQDTIEECIKSIQEQSYNNIEIIFVDDGSRDNTSEIIKAISINDKRVTYNYQKNSGANSARKNGFAKANGEFCMFIDGDDILERNAVETCIKHITNNNVEVYGNWIIYNGYQAVYYMYKDGKLYITDDGVVMLKK